MAKRILVVGRNTFDSGKTAFVGVLARELVNSGAKAEYFKPISAHNYSEKLAHTKQCLKEGRLYSFDLATISEILESSVDKYISNPVHRLYVPANLSHGEVSRRQIGTLGLAGLDAVVAMERLSRPINENPDSTLLVAKTLIEQGKLLITIDEVEVLSKNSAITEIDTLERVQEIEAQRIEDDLTHSLHVVEKKAEFVLIESFNDSVWPWAGLETVDSVAVVSQGKAALYDPSRFRKAAFLKKRNLLPIREVDFTRIAELMQPLKKIEWQRNEENRLTEELGIDF